MKQLLLAAALIAVPVIGFSGFHMVEASYASATPATLGDMSAFTTIIADVQKISASGDMAAAQARITDWESAWDNAEVALRPKNQEAWGNIDMASDGALKAVRAKAPDAAKVQTALAALMTALQAK
ncbi:MAG: hypothetical protein ABIV25_13470 [Paracoccaceae bacterium]